MAKKKKDAEENIDNKEEFNDIDENFGLPDLDLEPLDDSEEEDEAVVEEVAEEPEEEVIEEVAQSEEESYTYETSEDESHTEETEEESSEPETTYVPGTYAAKAKEENSGSSKTVGIIVIVLVIVACVVGWYFYNQSQVAAEKAKQEQLAKKQADEAKARKAQEEKDRIAQEEADEAARLQAIEDAEPEIGTVETISSATGRYYVVVSSSIDEDLAMDYVNKELQKGTNIKMLAPLGKSKFHRVTVDDHDSWAAAENAANDLKATYGDGVWVLKY